MTLPAGHPPTFVKAASFTRLLFCSGFRQSMRGFSTGFERLRWGGVGRGNGKQFGRVDLQGRRQPFHQIEGGVEIASLKSADRGAINFGINRKIFLRDFACGPNRPKIPCNTFAKPHDGMKHHLVVALSIGYIRHNSSFSTLARLLTHHARYFKLPANRRG